MNTANGLQIGSCLGGTENGSVVGHACSLCIHVALRKALSCVLPVLPVLSQI
jgi:hypothetical protein